MRIICKCSSSGGLPYNSHAHHSLLLLFLCFINKLTVKYFYRSSVVFCLTVYFMLSSKIFLPPWLFTHREHTSTSSRNYDNPDLTPLVNMFFACVTITGCDITNQNLTAMVMSIVTVCVCDNEATYYTDRDYNFRHTQKKTPLYASVFKLGWYLTLNS